VNKTLSFVNNIFTNVGTDEEKEQVGFTQRSQPMFIYGLKLAFQVKNNILHELSGFVCDDMT